MVLLPFPVSLLKDWSAVAAAAAAAKSCQSCPTLCDPTDSSPPGSAVPVLQAREPEWVATAFSRRTGLGAAKVCQGHQFYALTNSHLSKVWLNYSATVIFADSEEQWHCTQKFQDKQNPRLLA